MFSTRVISCAPREALYVLDGLLENPTTLEPREHYTDTHGFTEHLFGLCRLLGIRFMPRLKDLKDQRLYRFDRHYRFGDVDELFHGAVSVGLLREQWEPLLRVAAALKSRVTPAHVILERLTSATRSDRLSKALKALGRLEKTVYLLRYLQDGELRDRVYLQFNRGEARHALARRLFFSDQGEFRTGDYEEIMNRATCLSLLSNAVLVWNTVKMAEVVTSLRLQGQVVRDEDLARISPLASRHVIPNGRYDFRSPPLPDGRARP